MKYVVGRGNWIESVAVGIVAFIALIVVTPFLLIAAPLCLVLGVCGLWKRAE